MDRFVLALLEGLLDQAEGMQKAMVERMPHAVVTRPGRMSDGTAIGTPLGNVERLVVGLRAAVKQGSEEVDG